MSNWSGVSSHGPALIWRYSNLRCIHNLAPDQKLASGTISYVLIQTTRLNLHLRQKTSALIEPAPKTKRLTTTGRANALLVRSTRLQAISAPRKGPGSAAAALRDDPRSIVACYRLGSSITPDSAVGSVLHCTLISSNARFASDACERWGVSWPPALRGRPFGGCCCRGALLADPAANRSQDWQTGPGPKVWAGPTPAVPMAQKAPVGRTHRKNGAR